jgi:hypothetical protein
MITTSWQIWLVSCDNYRVRRLKLLLWTVLATPHAAEYVSNMTRSGSRLNPAVGNNYAWARRWQKGTHSGSCMRTISCRLIR